MTAARHHTLALALLAACSLRPYTFDADTSEASATTTSSASPTTGTTSTTTTSSVATTTTGGPIPGAWFGHYRLRNVLFSDPEHQFRDCASDEIWELVSDDLPYMCSEAEHGDGLYLHVAGVLRPDGDDDDEFDELEIIAFLADPCVVGSCEEPLTWSSCGTWEDSCGALDCDVWLQDCPEGQKCMPFSGDGDNSWESLKCVPVAPGAGEAGDPCTAEGGGVSGIDTCAEGHICWYLDAQANGTCVPQCIGSPDSPTCPDCTSDCTIAGDGVLTLCLPNCSPLLQDCPEGELCIPNMGRFICVLDGSGDEGQLFDPCEYANACDPGLLCITPEHASECDQEALGCCLPFCDLNQPVCPGAGLECVPWSDPAPACNESLGVCRLPP